VEVAPLTASEGRRLIWAAERVVLPMKPGNVGGGKDPYF
jgi:hypothetical protein